MAASVLFTKLAHKQLERLPNHIRLQLRIWVECIEFEGYQEMQKTPGYRDHSLQGTRNGQRSSSLSRSWRVIYIRNDESSQIIIKVLEVNHHEY